MVLKFSRKEFLRLGVLLGGSWSEVVVDSMSKVEKMNCFTVLLIGTRNLETVFFKLLLEKAVFPQRAETAFSNCFLKKQFERNFETAFSKLL